MKKHLLRSVLALVTMLFGVATAAAAIPEHLYMVGTASPSLWDINAIEIVNEGDGVFSYTGNLYQGELQFMSARNWENATRYVPEVSGWHIVDAATATILQEVNSDRKWWVPEYGEWNIRVAFTDGGETVSITATRAGEMTPQVYALGAATGQWDCQWPGFNSYILPEETEPNVFVWEGTLPLAENCAHFKFIAYPKAWDQGCIFYVPETVDFNGNVKLVKPGDKLKVQQTTNGNGPLDWFWGFTLEDCAPYKHYKVTLNLNDMTIEFAGGEETHIPEHLYMVGTASPSLWNPDMLEMTSEGNGVFTYHGNLYMGEMRFLDIPDFAKAISYVPFYGGTHITDTSAHIVQIEGEPGRNWWVPDYGEWNIKVVFADGGTNVSITAERVGDMTPQVYALGAATGQWDCQWPGFNSYILPEESEPNVFVWEGTLAPVENCAHFKFIAYPKAWDQGCIFYVPEAVDFNGNVKLVKPGDKLKVQQTSNGNGPLDWFWGFAMQDCTPYSHYRVILNLNDMTIEFAGGEETHFPEHLYMSGTASPSLTDTNALEMINEGEGVFSYHGNLYLGDLQFMDGTDRETALRYVPWTGGWHITEASTATIIQEVNSDRKWWVADYGEWDVKVRFTDGGKAVGITAERVGDMAPQAYALGAATGEWNCEAPAFSAYLWPREDDADVFVWEGRLNPDLGEGNADLRRHIKFIAYPKAWDQGCIFYVPESVDYNDNVKTVHVGDKLNLQQTTNGNGPLDWYWGFAAEDCDPDVTYRITLNLRDKTVEFADNKPVDGITDADSATFKASFVGDDLVIEGATSPVAVYDIAGRLVATSASASLTVPGLPAGVYVVRTAEAAVKLAR